MDPDVQHLLAQLQQLEHSIHESIASYRSATHKQQDVLSQLQATMRHQLSTHRALVRDLELLAEEQDTDELAQHVASLLRHHKQTYDSLQQAQRAAVVALHVQATNAAAEERRQLLGTAEGRVRRAAIRSEADAVAVAESTTASLRRTHQVLTQELEQTSATFAVLEESNKQLAAARDELAGQRAMHRTAGSLLKTMNIHAVFDWVVLWGGLSLFIVVVAYIVQKRMLFFVPNSLSMGFFGATARRQPGSDAAHTNDPPPGLEAVWGVKRADRAHEPMLDLGHAPVPPPVPEGWEDAAAGDVGWAPNDESAQQHGTWHDTGAPETAPADTDEEPPLTEHPPLTEQPHEPAVVYAEVPEPEFVQATAPEPSIPEPPAPEQPVYVEPPAPEPPVYVEPPAPEPPVYVEPPAPEPPVYVEPPAPEPPVYVEPPAPEPPVYVEPPAPEPPVYVEPPAPEPPVYVEPAAPEPPAPAVHAFQLRQEDPRGFADPEASTPSTEGAPEHRHLQEQTGEVAEPHSTVHEEAAPAERHAPVEEPSPPPTPRVVHADSGWLSARAQRKGAPVPPPPSCGAPEGEAVVDESAPVAHGAEVELAGGVCGMDEECAAHLMDGDEVAEVFGEGVAEVPGAADVPGAAEVPAEHDVLHAADEVGSVGGGADSNPQLVDGYRTHEIKQDVGSPAHREEQGQVDDIIASLVQAAEEGGVLSEVLTQLVGGERAEVPDAMRSAEPVPPTAHREVPVEASGAPPTAEAAAAPPVDAPAEQELAAGEGAVVGEPTVYRPVATPVPDREEVVYEYGYHDVYEQGGAPMMDYHDGV